MNNNRNYICSICGTPCVYSNFKSILACECGKHGEWAQDYSGYWSWAISNGAKPIPIEDYIPNKR